VRTCLKNTRALLHDVTAKLFYLYGPQPVRGHETRSSVGPLLGGDARSGALRYMAALDPS
jgi:hypothetical protein